MAYPKIRANDARVESITGDPEEELITEYTNKYLITGDPKEDLSLRNLKKILSLRNTITITYDPNIDGPQELQDRQ